MKTFKKSLIICIVLCVVTRGGLAFASGEGFVFMKLIPLSKTGKKNKGKFFAQVDDTDYEWLNQWNWAALVKKRTVYAIRIIDNKKSILMHRQIMNIINPKLMGDHKDHNGLNNQRENLRICNPKQNSANRSSRLNSSSRFLGVSWNSQINKWVAQIVINRKLKILHRGDNEQEAARAYDNEAKKLHGEFANLNFK